MTARRRFFEAAQSDGFEFDHEHNTIFFKRIITKLLPDKSSNLRVLLNNCARLTPIGTLIQNGSGGREPGDAAAVSIRVAMQALRKTIEGTGMRIKRETKLGYEIAASHIPELNRRLPDKMLIALNLALATGGEEIVKLLRAAWSMAEARRQKWTILTRATTPSG